jgi:F-type H+-transporting ATPase subunit delta
MIHSASRHAVEELRVREHAVFEGRISVDSLVGLANELYSVARLLGTQPRLRRALADSSEAVEKRQELLQRLFGEQLDRQALGLVSDAIALEWSSPWDLADAIEGCGDDAVFRAAEKDGDLDRIEDELFRLERILQSHGETVSLLDEQSTDADRRVKLLDALVGEKVSPLTIALLRNAVRSTRKRSVLLALDDLLERAVAWQERSVARVVSAAPLTDEQSERVARALSELYGRPIVARTAVDPAVKGGLLVRVGDDVIDGSVVARIAAVRSALTG